MTVWIENGEIIERRFDTGTLTLSLTAGNPAEPNERHAVTIGEITAANGLRAAAMASDVYRYFNGSGVIMDIFRLFL